MKVQLNGLRSILKEIFYHWIIFPKPTSLPNGEWNGKLVWLHNSFLPSSTVLSSWVTLMARRSILAWRLFALADNPWASLASSPNRSSAWRLKLDNCLTVFARVPLVAASSSDGNGYPSGMVFRDTWTGCTTLFGRGIFILSRPSQYHFL